MSNESIQQEYWILKGIMIVKKQPREDFIRDIKSGGAQSYYVVHNVFTFYLFFEHIKVGKKIKFVFIKIGTRNAERVTASVI